MKAAWEMKVLKGEKIMVTGYKGTGGERALIEVKSGKVIKECMTNDASMQNIAEIAGMLLEEARVPKESDK